jgi:hypothetical protein
MADNNFGISLSGGAFGGAFGGLGISNFTVMTVGLIMLAGLGAHLFNRRKAIEANNKARWHKHYAQMRASLPHADKRKRMLSHEGHGDPMNYEDAAGDLYAYVCSITLPDTALENGDRIHESIRRHRNRLQDIIDSVTEGQMSSEEGHHHIHGMAQHIMHELDLPHRDSVEYMPHALSGFE